MSEKQMTSVQFNPLNVSGYAAMPSFRDGAVNRNGTQSEVLGSVTPRSPGVPRRPASVGQIFALQSVVGAVAPLDLSAVRRKKLTVDFGGSHQTSGRTMVSIRTFKTPDRGRRDSR
jgi:hypothetical protein